MDYNDPLRRDGRAVECTGLENQQALIGLPGFESLSLRQFILQSLLAQALQQNLQNHATGQQEMKIFHCYHSDEHN